MEVVVYSAVTEEEEPNVVMDPALYNPLMDIPLLKAPVTYPTQSPGNQTLNIFSSQ